MSSRSTIKPFEIPEPDSVYANLLDRLPAAVYVCDANGFITYYNEAAVTLWGRRPELGKDLWCGSWKIFDLDGTPIPLDSCAMAETLKAGTAVARKEIIIEQAGGQRFHVLPQPHPILDKDGVVTGAINMLVDLTDRVNFRNLQKQNRELSQAVEALRRSEERYHRMIAEVQDYAIILLSREGIIENWNVGAEKIKGYSEQEILGKHFRILYPAEDQAAQIPEKLINLALTSGRANYEGWRVRKDGSRFWGSISITALHDDQGNVTGFSKVTRDLTEKKKAEENLRKASIKLEQQNQDLVRINEELSSFAYISSHDLQEPLRKIQTFSDRIIEMEYQNLSDKGKDYFMRMQEGAARMQKLIRDILAYSRTTTSEKKLEVTNLNDLLAHAKAELEVMIVEKNAVIESDLLPAIKVIPFQVQQLFNNLLNNALKFSKKDAPSHIVIRTAMVNAKTLPERKLLGARTYCHISIKDNGIGFEPEYEKKIFEVFQRLHGRTEYGGTGIGLAICKKIVENHQGLLTAEGLPGQGATFHVYLPIIK